MAVALDLAVLAEPRPRQAAGADLGADRRRLHPRIATAASAARPMARGRRAMHLAKNPPRAAERRRRRKEGRRKENRHSQRQAASDRKAIGPIAAVDSVAASAAAGLGADLAVASAAVAIRPMPSINGRFSASI